MRSRILTPLRRAVVALILLGFAMQVFMLHVVGSFGEDPLPDHFGNWQRNRDLVLARDTDGKPSDFSFAVVGDVNNSAPVDEIMRVFRQTDHSFMVLNGDIVRRGMHGEHAFLRETAPWRYDALFPVFYVPGNHDISRLEEPDETIGVPHFEALYGPTNFSFEYEGCLFIFLRTLDKPRHNPDSLAFLRKTLETPREGEGPIFVFMHIPPRISPDFRPRPTYESKEMMALFEEHRVSHVITGDYHGYARLRYNGVNYLVSGGGGSRLRDDRPGHFHHGIEIMIRDNFSVSERIVQVPHRRKQWLRFQRFWLCQAWPDYQKSPEMAIAANAGAFVLLGLLLFWGYAAGKRSERPEKES